MARIEAATHVEATSARVWQVLIDWEGQARWMQDAEQVEVLSGRREGVGVVIRAKTDLFGLSVDDNMEVTEWEPERILGVRHLGRVFSGVGAFELIPTSYGVHLVWWEELDPPLGAVGELAAQLFVVPVVERVFRRSLASLKRVAESRSVRP